MRFLREIKPLEARQRLEALVVPKRQALTRHQGLLAPSEGSCCGLASDPGAPFVGYVFLAILETNTVVRDSPTTFDYNAAFAYIAKPP